MRWIRFYEEETNEYIWIPESRVYQVCQTKKSDRVVVTWDNGGEKPVIASVLAEHMEVIKPKT